MSKSSFEILRDKLELSTKDFELLLKHIKEEKVDMFPKKKGVKKKLLWQKE